MITTVFACLLAIASVTVSAQPRCEGPPCQNFTQKLNHDKPGDNATFLQRYQLDTSHFKPGGPILFHQNEEAAITSNPLPIHVFNDYAANLGAMVVGLEHRYFGTSYPEGLSVASNITAAQYAPLTLDNVLGDSVAFVGWLKSTVPGAQNSPVIFGSGKTSTADVPTGSVISDLSTKCYRLIRRLSCHHGPCSVLSCVYWLSCLQPNLQKLGC